MQGPNASAATTTCGFESPAHGSRTSTPGAARLGTLWYTTKRHWIWLGPVMIVTVGAFDLLCTLSAFEKGWLVEMNPIAAALLERWGSPGLAVYRFVMTAAGCILLSWGLRMYRLRRFVGANVARVRRMVWGSQIVLVGSHMALVAWWVAWLSV